jgi:integrase
MVNPLHIPESKKWKGLTVYCRKCNTNVDYCRTTGKKLQQCSFGDKHVYKVYVHVPGTKNERKTKNLKSRNIDEAIREAMEFEREIKQGHFNIPTVVKSDTHRMERGGIAHYPLDNAFARYIGWLNNENVPFHRQKERSPEHIKDVQRAIEFFWRCLIKNNHNMNLGVEHLNDDIMGHFYQHLLEQKFADRTVNKYLSHLTSFLTWHMEEYKVPDRNWFTNIKREPLSHNPLTITGNEFAGLLAESQKHGNGVQYYESKSKPERDYERHYMPDVFRFGLYSGLRRENLLTAKFNNIQEENDLPVLMKVPDIKVNRIRKRNKPETMKYIYVPITNELRELLYSLGYEQYKGTDNYIIAPEINGNRTRAMSDLITRAFSHYYSKLNTGRELTFKSLRKTYITNLSLYLGENAKAITGHSDNAVIDEHYRSKEVIAKAAQGFGVFQKEGERKNELEQIRNNSKQNQLNQQIEK